MNPKLVVATAVVAGLLAAGTAMAAPMAHDRGGLRTDRGISSVPEPSTLTLALLAMGLTGRAVARRRRRTG